MLIKALTAQPPALTSVVCGRDRLKALLASSVPNLQFDPLAIKCDGSDLEVDAVRVQWSAGGGANAMCGIFCACMEHTRLW